MTLLNHIYSRRATIHQIMVLVIFTVVLTVFVVLILLLAVRWIERLLELLCVFYELYYLSKAQRQRNFLLVKITYS